MILAVVAIAASSALGNSSHTVARSAESSGAIGCAFPPGYPSEAVLPDGTSALPPTVNVDLTGKYNCCEFPPGSESVGYNDNYSRQPCETERPEVEVVMPPPSAPAGPGITMGSFVGCELSVTVDWGDSTSTTVQVMGPENYPPLVLGKHRYSRPGSYRITLSGKVLSGECAIDPNSTLAIDGESYELLLRGSSGNAATRHGGRSVKRSSGHSHGSTGGAGGGLPTLFSSLHCGRTCAPLFEVRPSRVSCQEAAGGELQLNWSSWTATKAIGAGSANQDFMGHVEHSHITVVAVDPVDGHFTGLQINYPDTAGNHGTLRMLPNASHPVIWGSGSF